MIDFPPLVAGADVVVSATSFSVYRRCPDQALARLQGRYPPETVPAFRGQLAHRLFARHLSSGPVADDDLTQVCREEIGAGMNPQLVALGLAPSALAGVIAEVGALYDRFKRLAHDGVDECETTLEVQPAEGVTLRGIVDAVFRDDAATVRLVDWKTGSLGEPDDQLAFYALLWTLARGAMPVGVEAVSVASGERFATAPSAASLAETATAVAGQVNTLRLAFDSGARAERRGGPWCRHCPVVDECGEGRAVLSVLGS